MIEHRERIIHDFETYEPNAVLRRLGANEIHETSQGHRLTIFPTCEVPRNALLPENWKTAINFGNFRHVNSIESLSDGTRPGLFVKAPERTYTRDMRKLAHGDIWWGGSRSGEKAIHIPYHSLIEEQALWEASILLALNQHGIPAELPQAVLEYSDGKKVVIIKEIKPSSSHQRFPRFDELIAKAESEGFLPEDASQYNCMRDRHGFNRLIDVNRWQWPPYTNGYRTQLLALVKDQTAQIDRAILS